MLKLNGSLAEGNVCFTEHTRDTLVGTDGDGRRALGALAADFIVQNASDQEVTLTPKYVLNAVWDIAQNTQPPLPSEEFEDIMQGSLTYVVENLYAPNQGGNQ